MATRASRSASQLMVSPAVLLLLGWMLIPLAMTIYFSFLRYNLLQPGATPFSGWENYYWFLTDPSFTAAIINTLILVGGVLLIICFDITGSTHVWAGYHTHNADRTILCNAYRRSACLEKYVYESCEWYYRVYCYKLGLPTN